MTRRGRVELGTDGKDEAMYDYRLVRKHTVTGEEQAIGFTVAVLYELDVADTEWK